MRDDLDMMKSEEGGRMPTLIAVVVALILLAAVTAIAVGAIQGNNALSSDERIEQCLERGGVAYTNSHGRFTGCAYGDGDIISKEFP